MSKLRAINTHFWEDNYILELDPIEKLLFIYLLSNPMTNMLGIYELNIRRISFDTGIDTEMVKKIFDRFEKAGKAKYSNGYVILANFIKHQSYNPNMQTSAIKSWNELPLEVRKDHFCEPLLKGLKGFDKGSEPIAEYELEYEYELETESEKERLSQPYSDEFEKVWVAYNRKGGKKASYTQWQKLSRADKDKAIAHIPSYIASRERKYTKDLERYLKDGVYESHLPTLQPTNQPTSRIIT